MSGANVTNLPAYRSDPDYNSQQRYQELLNVILRQWFNSDGFFLPSLTNAQVAQLLTINPPVIAGTQWYNSDLNKLQFMGSGNVVQTVTSV